MSRSDPRIWEPGVVAWVGRMYRSGWLSVAEIRDRVNARFGWRVTSAAISNLATKRGWRGARNSGRFAPGHAPHNKGRRVGILGEAHRRTLFRPGNRPANWQPIGAERRAMGQLQVKVGLRDPRIKGRGHWMSVAQLTWEAANGPLPKGMVVLHLDGDSDNDALDNLEAVDRGDLATRNKMFGRLAMDTESGRAALGAVRLARKVRSARR